MNAETRVTTEYRNGFHAGWEDARRYYDTLLRTHGFTKCERHGWQRDLKGLEPGTCRLCEIIEDERSFEPDYD